MESGTSRLRGFGYAEFDNINDLKEALLLKGEVCLSLLYLCASVECMWLVKHTLLNY